MFEVGFSEMIVIFALALVVLGPEKLPRLVAQLGRWAGRARAMARQFRDQLETEAQSLDSVRQVREQFETAAQSIVSTETQPPAATPPESSHDRGP